MQHTVSRLEHVVVRHPKLALRFQPGASPEKIAALETAVGPLSGTHKALYAWADGSVYQTETFRWTSLFSHPPLEQRLLPIDNAVASKRMWDEFARDFASSSEIAQKHWHFGFWHSTWVPLLETDWSMTAWAPEACFDGPAGQVVRFDFKGGAHWWIESASLDAWVQTLAELLRCDHELSLDTRLDEGEKSSRFQAFERQLQRRLHPDFGAVPLLPERYDERRFERLREKI